MMKATILALVLVFCAIATAHRVNRAEVIAKEKELLALINRKDLPQSYRCNGQDSGCCVPMTPCSLGEGDCDSNKDCAGYLTCGKDNCPWGDRDDCCVGQRCLGQDSGCCVPEKPCSLGEGDCDRDKDCAGYLTCGTDNCPWGDRDDCCEGQRCLGQDSGCCVPETPCSLGEGDCDSDKDCAGNLICGTDNCPWGDRDDCCTEGLAADLLDQYEEKLTKKVKDFIRADKNNLYKKIMKNEAIENDEEYFGK